jgi:hypothetical protein
MERAIGEVFEFEGERYRVEKSYNDCEKCSFDRGEYCYVNSIKMVGECSTYNRKDKLDVVFVKIVD